MGLWRWMLPRRKENLLNSILALGLLAMVIFFYTQLQPGSRRLAGHIGPTWAAGTAAMERREMQHKIPDYSTIRNGPGENGAAVHLTGEEKVEGEKQMKSWFMNVEASDKISLDRSIPDGRLAECKAIKYPTDLPRASVVIIFTDEAWSPLMRTVHSVINRSPPHLLKEIILLDDNSQREELKDNLTRYVQRFGDVVKLIRKTERHGLIRAKLAGAQEATGEVVVFLDSHCEANTGWLEPLLMRIKEKKSAVLCPVIDFISAETMAYSGDGGVSSVGGFWWSLHFRWDAIPGRESSRRKSPTEPVRSPTMAGGLLAADRAYFLMIGGYDPGMDIWGGENLEISFRVWMCGGSIEFIPCSHVGHIFRAGHPYNMTGPGGNKDVHGTNSKRLAEVWMDDYKRLYYLHRPDLKLRNDESQLCLDTLQRDEKMPIQLGVFACQSGGSSSQLFSLSKSNHLRRELTCAEVSQTREDAKKATIRLTNCHGASQIWTLEKNGHMVNKATGLCLDVDELTSGEDVLAMECQSEKASQIWTFKKYF